MSLNAINLRSLFVLIKVVKVRYRKDMFSLINTFHIKIFKLIKYKVQFFILYKYVTEKIINWLN